MKKLSEKFGDPRWSRKVHGWATIIWFILAFPICVFLSTSLPFIVFISVYAVVTGHWAAWQAARTEVLQEKEKERNKEAQERLKRIDPADPTPPTESNTAG